MRTIHFLLLMPLLVFSSCGLNNKKQAVSGESIYQQKVDKAFNDAETIKSEDTPFFLGFQMGMTPKQVKEQCSKLVTSGKITLSGNSYKYNIKDSNNEKIDFQTLLQFDYFNNELYKMSLNFTGKNSKGQSYVIDTGILFKLEFSQSWGKALKAQSYELYFREDGLDQYYYIKGNVIVTADDDSYYFTDVYRQKLKREAHQDNVTTDLINDLNM